MPYPSYNPNDIFISKRNSTSSSFEEYILRSSPDSIVAFDSASNLVAITVTPSASYALSASYVDGGGGTTLVTGSFYPITSSNSISSSYALSASYVEGGGGTTIITGSFYPITSSNSVSSSYSETGSVVPFDGNRSIKRSGYSGINVGGANVTEFLNNFFFPFVSATVSLSSGGTTYYQTGSSVTVTMTTTVTANDENSFGSASIIRDGLVWSTINTIPPLSFGSSDSSVSSSHTYTTFIQTNNNGSPTLISSNTKTVSFIFPYLWGMSSTAGLSGTSLYNAFTKQVVVSGNKTVSMVGNAVYMYFAYPTSYPPLTSILDPNSFEVINNFEYSSSVSVTSTGLSSDWTNTYRVYRTILVSDPNGNYQFKQ